MAKPKFKVLDTKLNKGSQTYTLTRIAELGEHKLRFSIGSDAYQSQSHATVSRWNGTEWKRVASILPASMATPTGLVYWPASRPVTEFEFNTDLVELKHQVMLILA